MTGSPLVSVIIPTKDAGPSFALLLGKLRRQAGVGELEIVVVDSGSSDGTRELARASSCRLVDLPARDFSHSRARNAGAELAAGRYLVFMVQDAFPAGDGWIRGFLDAFLRHAPLGVAAASCNEFPRRDADLFYAFLIHFHQKSLGCLDQDQVTERQGEDPASLWRSGAISNIACLIPRDIFRAYRFRGDYAEDVDLGIRLIQDGRRLLRLATVKVLHSHDRPPWYHLKRTFVDATFYGRRLGLVELPKSSDVAAAVSGARALLEWASGLAQAVSRHVPGLTPGELAERLRPLMAREQAVAGAAIADGDLRSFLERFDEGAQPRGVDAGIKAVAATFAHVSDFLVGVYPVVDASLLAQLPGLIAKLAAQTAGGLIAQHVLAGESVAPGRHAALRAALSEGV